MKKLLSLVILLSLCLSLNAQMIEQRRDSSRVSSFNPKELILPASLMAAGSLGFIPEVKDLVIDVRDDVLEWRGDRTTEIDTYLQFLPHLSYYGLSLVGLDAKHNYVDRTLVIATSTVATLAITHGAKCLFGVERPDGSDNRSFPSGHSARVFMGAELVRMEYGEEYPLIGVGAYTLATAVAALRVYNNRHWVTDVVAGAGVGILSARIGYWLLPYTREMMYRITGHEAFVYPMVGGNIVALGVSMSF